MSPTHYLLTIKLGHNFITEIFVSDGEKLEDAIEANGEYCEEGEIRSTQDPEIVQNWVDNCPACSVDRTRV